MVCYGIFISKQPNHQSSHYHIGIHDAFPWIRELKLIYKVRMMSRVRGKLLDDKEAIERRKWYSDLQSGCVESAARYDFIHRAEEIHGLEETTFPTDVVSYKMDPKYDDNIPSQWVVSVSKPKAPIATLVCFAGVGNSHSYFNKWSKALLNNGIALYAAALPGHMNRCNESTAKSLVEIANHIYLSLRDVNIVQKQDSEHSGELHKHRPLIFFGHCLGGLVAFEVARLLVRDGYHLAHLMVSAIPTPMLQTQRNRDKQGIVKYYYASGRDLLLRAVELGGIPCMDFFASRKDILKHCVAAIRRDYFILEKYALRMFDDDKYDTSTVASHALSDQHSEAKTVVDSKISVGGGGHHIGNRNQVDCTGIISIAADRKTVHSHSVGKYSSEAKQTSLSVHSSSSSSSRPSTADLGIASRRSGMGTAAAASRNSSTQRNANNGGSRYASGDDCDYDGDGGGDDTQVPAILFKLRVPITTVHCSGDESVTPEEVQQWSNLTNDYNHISMGPPPSSSRRSTSQQPQQQQQGQLISNNSSRRGSTSNSSYQESVSASVHSIGRNSSTSYGEVVAVVHDGDDDADDVTVGTVDRAVGDGHNYLSNSANRTEIIVYIIRIVKNCTVL